MNKRQHFGVWTTTSIAVLLSLVMVGCSKQEQAPEQVKIVMVTQPKNKHKLHMLRHRLNLNDFSNFYLTMRSVARNMTVLKININRRSRA